MDLKHECKQCHQRFENRTQVAKHMYLHKQGYICSHCSKPFASESGLKRHINANHSLSRSTFKCTICDLNFRLKRDFEKHHLSEHRADKHFECKQCGARFSWLINLTKHEKFHSDQKNTQDNLNDSTKEDSSVVKLYQCEICGKNFNYDFTYAIHLAGHEKSKHPPNEDTLNTTVTEISSCYTEEADESAVEGESSKEADGEVGKVADKGVMNYIPSEEENKDLFEYLNDCRTRQEGKLKRKRKDAVIYDFVMTEDKPFKCPQCDESFRWQVSFDIHLKFHSGDKTLKVRKPYSSSKLSIAEKKNKKKQSKRETSNDEGKNKSGDANTSKIIYQNESDEDNDIYEEEEEEDTGKERKLIETLKTKVQSNKDYIKNNNQENIELPNAECGEEDIELPTDEGGEEDMNAIDLLNSIGKPQTINDHDYL